VIPYIILALWPLFMAHAEPPANEHVHADQTAARLLNQAVLTYPEAAAERGLHGDVVLEVAIDRFGVVTGAEVVSGDAVFNAEALRAALTLSFEPARLAGAPVSSTVRVVFHFEPPATSPLLPSEPYIEIVVEGRSEDREDTHARETLGEEALRSHTAQDLGSTVSEVPGVTLSEGTASTSKPIIRGQTERRLLLLYDGIRHESQKWGADHAPEIDPASAGSISIIKGAAGVRYGPDAMGGVVLVTPRTLRLEPGVDGTARVLGGLNGPQAYGGLRLDLAPAAMEGFSARFQGNQRISADQRTPDYVLGNTASRELNLGASAGILRGPHQTRISWQRYDLTAGVFYGVRTGTPEDFEAGLEATVPTGAELWTVDTHIERPYQRVVHDTVSVRTHQQLSAHSQLSAIYAYQHNHREEFEPVRGDEGPPQYDFVLRSHAVDLTLDHGGPRGHTDGHDGGIGVQGLFQENVYTGLPLLPNYRGASGGIYLWERLHVGPGAVEAGGRLDHLSRTAYLSEGDYADHLRQETLGPAQCSVRAKVASCPTAYNAGSASVGGRWQILAERLELKIDLSTASRFPNVDELYLLGSAPTLPVYGLGKPDLGVESTWGASPTLAASWHLLHAEVSGFANWIPRYIQFAPLLQRDGSAEFDVTVRGAFPRFGFSPVDALFTGVDGFLELGPDTLMGLRVQGALVQAYDRDTGEHLVGIPADRGSAELVLRPPIRTLEDPELSVTGTAIAQQFRVDPASDLAPAPSGAFLLSAQIGASVPLQERSLHIGVQGSNLLNARYREYTSLLRYFANQPGRDLRAFASLDF